MQQFYAFYRNALQNPKTRTWIIILSILYIVSPIDLIPDFIPILGWIDDGVILSLLASELFRQLFSKKSPSEPINKPKIIEADYQKK